MPKMSPTPALFGRRGCYYQVSIRSAFVVHLSVLYDLRYAYSGLSEIIQHPVAFAEVHPERDYIDNVRSQE